LTHPASNQSAIYPCRLLQIAFHSLASSAVARRFGVTTDEMRAGL
jgi:hypothetical protein